MPHHPWPHREPLESLTRKEDVEDIGKNHYCESRWERQQILDEQVQGWCFKEKSLTCDPGNPNRIGFTTHLRTPTQKLSKSKKQTEGSEPTQAPRRAHNPSSETFTSFFRMLAWSLIQIRGRIPEGRHKTCKTQLL